MSCNPNRRYGRLMANLVEEQARMCGLASTKQEAQDRPDIQARVFKVMKDELNELLRDGAWLAASLGARRLRYLLWVVEF